MTNDLIRKTEVYLREILNIQARFMKWPGATSLPIYLQKAYDFYLGILLGKEYLLVSHIQGEKDTQATLKKQLQKIRELSGYPVVLLSAGVASYTRKRWIEQQIQFVVPGNQLYLPEHGLDLREHFHAVQKKANFLRPSTQAIVLFIINNHAYQEYTTKSLKAKTGYALMTLNRAFDELLEHDLAKDVYTHSHERTIYFVKRGYELWNDVKPLLKSPVKGRKWISCRPCKEMAFKKAGLSALNHLTMIGEPRLPIIAMTGEEYKLAIQNQEFREMSDEWGSNYQVEIWKYNPGIVTQEGIVDPLSLYLSLKDETDTRTRGEMEKLMENIQW